jgi:hypothetical protein
MNVRERAEQGEEVGYYLVSFHEFHLSLYYNNDELEERQKAKPTNHAIIKVMTELVV